MSAINRRPGQVPGAPLEATMWSEGEPTPAALSEREDALVAMIECKDAALSLRDEEIA